MNKKSWWQKIKQNYPLTLADCRAFFEMRHREVWRSKMQDPKELLTYFQERYIRIDIRPSYRGIENVKFGYKLYAIGITIHADAVFTERELAAYDALEFAFRQREQYLERRSRKTDFKPKSRWHKEERKLKSNRPNWGERVQKNKKE